MNNENDDNKFEFEEEMVEKEFTIEESVLEPESEAELGLTDSEELEVELDEGPAAEIEEPVAKSSMTRILVLVLLLVAAAAGYFFFLGGEEPPPATITAKQPINLPVKKPVPAPERPTLAATKPTQPAAPEAAPVVKPASVAVAETEPAAAKASEPAAAEVAKPTAAAAAVAQTSEPKIEPAAAAEEQPATMPVAASGDYTVQVGAYVIANNLKDAKAQAATTGYPVYTEEARKLTNMTRLRYGLFPAAEADAKLAELKQNSPSAFKIVDGDQAAVYAGSYTDLDKARLAADLLYEKGIILEEVQAEVPIPLTLLKLGPFADRAAAEAAAAKAEATGLPAQVLKKPVQ